MEFKSVAVIGMGLIGGSLAKALRRLKNINTIIGIDTDEETLGIALDEGVIDEAYTGISDGIADSDMVFICTPLDKIVDSVYSLIKVVKPECIITDTGSIKSRIIKNIEDIPANFNFIGGHPMCGTEKSGYKASKAHLFENAYYILTPCSKTLGQSVDVMEKILIEIGAIPVIIEDRKHDILTGAISHVPHIISAALVNIVKEMDSEEKHMQKLAAGGFKDITRISSSNPDMWKSVVLNNKEHIREILKKFSQLIEQFMSYLDSEDKDRILGYFDSARNYRDLFNEGNVGLIAPFYDITVDMEDRPGEIGRLAMLLGENSINIKNINIINSREHDNGCLRITFPDIDSVDKACSLLKENGYRAYKI